MAYKSVVKREKIKLFILIITITFAVIFMPNWTYFVVQTGILYPIPTIAVGAALIILSFIGMRKSNENYKIKV